MRKPYFLLAISILALFLTAAVSAASIYDPDEDGIPSSRDNCDNVYNPDQKDSDGDGLGDACDGDEPPSPYQCGYPPINGIYDPDGDGITNSRDNCDCVSNPGQEDSDNDGTGDACDDTTPGQPDYWITKSVSPSSARSGDVVTYTVRIGNNNANAGTVTYRDSFSGTSTISNGGASLTFVPNEVITGLGGASASGTLSSASGITFTNIRDTVTVTYQARASTQSLFSGSATVTNTARLSNGDTGSASVTVLADTNGGQLTISKSVSDADPAHNDIITYTITIRNTGSSTVSQATVIDDIGRGNGVLRGTTSSGYGGRIVHLGTQSVSGASYDQSTSIGTPRGLRLLDIPAGATVTITYPARVDTSDLGSGVSSAVFNTATVLAQSAYARVDLRGTTVPPPPNTGRNPPFILPIPAQVQTCGIGFDALDLDDFVSDADNANSELLFSVDGNRRFQARVDPVTHVLSVTDPSGVQDGVSESVRLTVRDPQGNIATRTIAFSVLRTTFGKPIISGIPDQIVRKGRDFDGFDLDTYTQIGGTPLGNRTANYYVVGSTLFDVQISGENRVDIEYDEDLFKFTDADMISEELTFVMRGCSEAQDTAVFTVMREIPGEVIPRPPGEHTCVIVPRAGVQIKDTDCDGVPDNDDNCVTVKNPDQRDADRNGVGDACDLTVSCEPMLSTALDAGKSLQVRVGVVNNLETQPATIRYSASIDKLGVKDTRTAAAVPRGELGESVLRLRIPECAAAGKYTLTCSVQMGAAVASEKYTLDIKPGSACAAGGEDGSDTRFFQMQDVIKGSQYGASYPITIENNGEQQRSYVLEVDGILPWGDYSFESGSVVVVPAGQKETTNLRIYALPNANTGTYPFKVTVRSGDEQQDTYLQANVVPEDVLPAAAGGVNLSDLVWLFLIVIVLGAILFFAYRAREK